MKIYLKVDCDILFIGNMKTTSQSIYFCPVSLLCSWSSLPETYCNYSVFLGRRTRSQVEWRRKATCCDCKNNPEKPEDRFAGWGHKCSRYADWTEYPGTLRDSGGFGLEKKNLTLICFVAECPSKGLCRQNDCDCSPPPFNYYPCWWNTGIKWWRNSRERKVWSTSFWRQYFTDASIELLLCLHYMSTMVYHDHIKKKKLK